MTERVYAMLRSSAVSFSGSQRDVIERQSTLNNSAIYALIALDFLFFLFFPTLALMVAVLFVFVVNEKRGVLVKFLLLLLASYLSLINITKLPESDLLSYIGVFDDIRSENYDNFRVISMMRDQGFLQFTRLLSAITDDAKMFILFSSLLSYFVFLYALNFILLQYGVSPAVRALYVISAAFFPLLFSISAHVIRQFMAASILVFSISMLMTRPWVALMAFLISISFHLSILFFSVFAPIAMQVVQRKKSTVRLIFYYFIGVMAFLFMVALFMDNPIVALLVSRSSGGGGTQLSGIGFLPHIFNLAVLMISLHNIVLYTKCSELVCSNFIRLVSYIALSLSLLIIAVTVLQVSSEIATRYLFYQYFFVWLILPPFVQSFKEKKWVFLIMVVTCVIMFYLYLMFGPWNYAGVAGILMNDVYALYTFGNGY